MQALSRVGVRLGSMELGLCSRVTRQNIYADRQLKS